MYMHSVRNPKATQYFDRLGYDPWDMVWASREETRVLAEGIEESGYGHGIVTLHSIAQCLP